MNRFYNVSGCRHSRKVFLLSSYQTSSSFIYGVHLWRSSPENRHRLLQSLRTHHIQLPSNASYKLNKQNVRVSRVFTTTPLFPELHSFSLSVSHANASLDPLLPSNRCYLHYFLIRYEIFYCLCRVV